MLACLSAPASSGEGNGSDQEKACPHPLQNQDWKNRLLQSDQDVAAMIWSPEKMPKLAADSTYCWPSPEDELRLHAMGVTWKIPVTRGNFHEKIRQDGP